MSPRSAGTDQGIGTPIAVGVHSVAERTDRTCAAITPCLADWPESQHQLVLDLAVDLAYARGFADGRPVGLAAGHAVRFRVDLDDARRLDDARTGDYRGKSEQRDDRLMDNLRSVGIIGAGSAGSGTASRCGTVRPPCDLHGSGGSAGSGLSGGCQR